MPRSILQVLKERNCQPRILYPDKISFRKEREIKISTNDRKLRECVISRPALKKGMTIGSSSNRKEMIKEGILENQEGKTGKRKNMSKYNSLFLLLSLLYYF